MSTLQQTIARLNDAIAVVQGLRKSAGMAPPPGAPPMDPAMMGGAPPPGMDPAMMGGAPPPGMDPAAMGGGMPVDPATGMPIDPNTGMPMDPAAMGGAPPPEAAGLSPEVENALAQLTNGMDELVGMVEGLNQSQQKSQADKEKMQQQIMELNVRLEALEKSLSGPAPFGGEGGI